MFASLKKLALVAAPFAVAMVSNLAAAQGAPDYVRIRNITWNGTGCPLGTTAANVSPDLQAFTLIFSQFAAEVGPGVSIREKTKFCQVNLDLDFPSGWSFTVFTADYRGYAAVDRGITGTIDSTYYFQGDARQARLSTRIAGAYDSDYLIRDTLGVDAYVWSPCGAQRALNIKTQATLTTPANRNARGLLTVDSIDGQFKQIYRIAWQRCR
jgi:hypothetical protein